MINAFKNFTVETPIGRYPELLNYNFQQVVAEFGHIFMDSSNALTTNFLSPNGRVESHWGIFHNLQCRSFSIIGTDFVLDADFINDLGSHGGTTDRFMLDFTREEKAAAYSSANSNDWTTDAFRNYFAHDDNVIISTHGQTDFFKYASGAMAGPTLRDELDLLEGQLAIVIRHLNIKDAYGNTVGGQQGSETDAAPVRTGLIDSDNSYETVVLSDITDCIDVSQTVDPSTGDVTEDIRTPKIIDNICKIGPDYNYGIVTNTTGYVTIPTDGIPAGGIVTVIFTREYDGKTPNIKLNENLFVLPMDCQMNFGRIEIIRTGDAWDVYRIYPTGKQDCEILLTPELDGLNNN